MSPPPPSPVAVAAAAATARSHAQARPPRVALPYLLGFISTTVSSALITYLAYTHHDTAMSLFSFFIYVLYFFLVFFPTLQPPSASGARGRHVTLALWALLSAGTVGSACVLAAPLTPPESLCFLGVAISGSALVVSAWSGGHREQYAEVVGSFGPIMLMFFGLSRPYLIPHLLLHSTIVNARTFLNPTTTSLNKC